jgi:transposase
VSAQLTAKRVILKVKHRAELERTARSAKAPYRQVLRAKIVLLAADGVGNEEIARRLSITDDTARKWRGRFAASRSLKSLADRPRSGRPAQVPVAVRCQLVKLACERVDEEQAPFRDVWTHNALGLALAEETGWYLSLTEIGRILRTADLRPHRMRLWLHSPDPDFRAKVEAVCRLYTEPPAGATVLCVDEKTSIQALSRRFPGRPAAPGRLGRFEFEYKRHGTVTLLAALDVRTGKIYGECRARRTAADLLEYMEAVARRYPTGAVYIVWDNLNIHHGQRWERFNAAHGGRFHFVHTPKHASWVNQIEIWFGILQRRILRRGHFTTKAALVERIDGFIAYWNRHEAHPFNWKFRGKFVHHRAPVTRPAAVPHGQAQRRAA